MKVLIYTATYGNGPQPDTIATVKALTFKGQMQHEVSWYNPFPAGDARNITVQLIRARQMTLNGKFDALLTVEHDMRVPAHALQALWDLNAAVAYGVYHFRRHSNVINAYQVYGDTPIAVGQSLSNDPARLAAAIKQGVVAVSGLGFGCTLIRRDVLRQIQFADGDADWKGSDVMFSEACLKKRVEQQAHFGVLCGHWDGTRWMTPFEPFKLMPRDGAPPGAPGVAPAAAPVPAQARAAVPGYTHVIAAQTMNARVGTESMRLIAGREYDLPTPDASELARVGYVMVAG